MQILIKFITCLLLSILATTISRNMETKTRKHLLAFLTITTCILIFMIKVPTHKLPLSIQLDGKDYVLQENTTLSAYLEDGFYINDELQTYHELIIGGISLNSMLSDVEPLLTANHASLDYEYDPYHDGCTEIGLSVYTGEMIDLQKIEALDCHISITYIYKNGDWELVDNSQSPNLEGELCFNVGFLIQGPNAETDTIKYGMVRGLNCSLERR